MSRDVGAHAFALRRMTRDDLRQVAAIEAASLPTPWSEDAFRHELDIPFSRAFVAHPLDDPCTVAGYVVLWCVADEVHLLDLAVEATSRRRGIGRLLMEQVLDEAIRGSASLITLEVAEVNQDARRLYERLGFAICSVRKDYYGPGRHAVAMTRPTGRSV